MLNCTNSKSKLIRKVCKLFHKVQKESFHAHMKKILAGYQNQGRKGEEEMKKKEDEEERKGEDEGNRREGKRKRKGVKTIGHI